MISATDSSIFKWRQTISKSFLQEGMNRRKLVRRDQRKCGFFGQGGEYFLNTSHRVNLFPTFSLLLEKWQVGKTIYFIWVILDKNFIVIWKSEAKTKSFVPFTSCLHALLSLSFEINGAAVEAAL